MIALQRIRWYNPKRESFEWREAPKSDEEALSLLSSSAYTQSCTDTYWYWRKLDATITAALLRAGEQAIEEDRKLGEVEKSLGQLAEEINAEHRAFVSTFGKTLEHGIRAGGLLAAAKERCPHGTWLRWLAENFEGAVRTAQEYMRLHSHRHEVREKARDSAHLSMSGALKEIAVPRETAEAKGRGQDRTFMRQLQQAAQSLGSTEAPRVIERILTGRMQKSPGDREATADITEHHRLVRAIRAEILSRSGVSQEDIARELEVDQKTVNNITQEIIFADITEALLQEALDKWPEPNEELNQVAKDMREEMIFGHWSEDEQALLETFREGKGIVVNMYDPGPHANLVAWLKDTKRLFKADRSTKWGNPFEMPDDGDRETVVRLHKEHYLPHKRKLLDELPRMGGTAWGCWCAPQECHCDELLRRAEGEGSSRAQ